MRKKLSEQQITEKLRKRCVKLAKELAKQRDNHTCCYCGVGKPQRVVHSHHIFSEGLNKSMSSDIDNLITLCWIHHLGGLKFVSTRNFSFHGSPSDATEWVKSNYPSRYRELHQRSLKPTPCDMIYWQKRLEQLNNISEENGQGNTRGGYQD